jgi:hypothetical protein
MALERVWGSARAGIEMAQVFVLPWVVSYQMRSQIYTYRQDLHASILSPDAYVNNYVSNELKNSFEPQNIEQRISNHEVLT